MHIITIQVRTKGTFEAKEFSGRGFGPLRGPQWIKGEGLAGPRGETPEVNRFYTFTQ